MKKANTVEAVLASENSSTLQDKRTVFNIASLPNKSNLFGAPSLGEPYHRAKAMAELLDTMQSGMAAFRAVFNAYKAKYGNQFLTEFYREVHR